MTGQHLTGWGLPSLRCEDLSHRRPIALSEKECYYPLLPPPPTLNEILAGQRATFEH